MGGGGNPLAGTRVSALNLTLDSTLDLLRPVRATAAAVVRPDRRGPAAIELDDVELAAACRRGEARALETLYHRYKRRVFGMVTRIVGTADAEEVAQEVFVRVF